MMTTKIYDILIIGGGTAGLSAALGASRMRMKSLVFDAGNRRNAAAHEMHSVLSRDGENPNEFLQIGREQIQNTYSEYSSIIDTSVVEVRRDVFPGIQQGGKPASEGYSGFAAVDKNGTEYLGRKLVLAMGSRDKYPDIKGFAENWPEHIYHCLFCDGLEAHGTNKRVAVLANVKHFQMTPIITLMARRMTTKGVTVLTNGAELPDDEAGKRGRATLEAADIQIETRPIEQLINKGPGPENGVDVVLAGSTPETLHFSFIQYHSEVENNSDQLIEQLGLERNLIPGSAGEPTFTPPMMATNVPGCFVCGDLSQPFIKQVAMAMSSGSAAGMAAAHSLLSEENEYYASLAGV